jgi:hypothetical protein
MLRGLNDAGVEYVVIGGVAAVAHGSSFLTNDLDVCYRAGREHLERLARLLRAWRAYPRGWSRACRSRWTHGRLPRRRC